MHNSRFELFAGMLHVGYVQVRIMHISPLARERYSLTRRILLHWCVVLLCLRRSSLNKK